MSISAYAMGQRVWLVHTADVAQKVVPETLPIDSVVLEPGAAIDFYLQLGMAIEAASRAKPLRGVKR